MLLDENGEVLAPSMEKSDVLKRLRDIAPRNPEQERVLARKVGESIEYHRKKRINDRLRTGFDGLFAENERRKRTDDNWSPKKEFRHIASIPKEMVYIAEQIWGEDVLTNKEKFREAFIEDESGRLCLTVDPRTI